MNSKRVTKPGPPPEEEYEFSRLTDKDGEFADELPAACWWEYLRRSERARAAVAEYRSGKHVLPPAVEGIRNIVGVSLLGTLSLVPEFPARAWLSLPIERPGSPPVDDTTDHLGFNEAERARLCAGQWQPGEVPQAQSAGQEWLSVWTRPAVAAIINDSLSPAAWIVEDAYRAFPSGIIKEQGTKGRETTVVRLPILGGSARARGTARRSLLMTINWESNDEQILDAVRTWIKANRPKTHTVEKRSPRLSGGNLKFPYQYNKALGWLTPHRLHEALGCWKDVVREMRRPIFNPYTKKNEYPETDSLEEMDTKAKAIIAWLDGGAWPAPKK